jgi:hypothetical protein
MLDAKGLKTNIFGSFLRITVNTTYKNKSQSYYTLQAYRYQMDYIVGHLAYLFSDLLNKN